MASPLELASYVQHQGELGRQRGTQNRLASLASQAYGAPVQERRGLVQQAIGADPTAGFALGQSLEQDRGQQMGSLSQKARMLVGYAKAGNQQGVQSLYPQLAAEAQQLGLGQGIPQQWDESFLPGIEQLAMMGGADTGNTIHSQRVLADGRILNTYRDGRTEVTDHEADIQSWMRDHPGMAPQIIRRSGEVVPLGGQSAPMAQQQDGDPFTGLHAAVPGLRVTSQLRDPQRNQEVGGVPNSHHLTGQAIDIGRPSPEQQAGIRQWAQANGYRIKNDYEDGHWHLEPAPRGGGTIPGAGVPVRPSEGQVAAEQELAKIQAGLSMAPQVAAAEAQAAGMREGAVQESRTVVERRAELPLARSSMDNALDGLRRMAQTAREVRDNPALGRITGVMGQIPDLPGSEAANVRAQLENTLRSQVGFGVLQAMRDASKTGGALGQVSNIENILLQENLAALANTQSDEAMRQQLDKIIEYAEGAQQRLQDAFNDTYSEALQGQGSATQGGDVDDLLNKYGVR